MHTNWVGWMLSILVLLLLCLSGYMMQNSVRLLISGERALGIVVSMDSSSRFTSEPGKAKPQSSLVEFTTSSGEKIRVTGRAYSSKPSAQMGDPVRLAYSRSNPNNTQFLQLDEFPVGPAGFVLGFAILIILLWISGILVSGDPTLADPLNILPAVISHFHLNPVRFPVIFLLSLVIPGCGIAIYSLTRQASELKSLGIRAIGQVEGIESNSRLLNSGGVARGSFPMITFEDQSGFHHTIRRSLAKPLSRLKYGDLVEVIYPANNPKRAVVNTWDELWLYPVVFVFFLIASLFIFVLVWNGYEVPVIINPETQKRLMKSGVPAIATVIDADLKAKILHYRVDKDPSVHNKKLDGFISIEQTLSDRELPKTDTEIHKGDQFRAYLDTLNPFENFYTDFNHRIGSNPSVKSMAEEDKEEETVK